MKVKELESIRATAQIAEATLSAIEKTDNPYPSVYIRMKALSSVEVDKVNSVIYEDGCTALQGGVGNIYNDVEHYDYFNT